jgi:hypothetical protein
MLQTKGCRLLGSSGAPPLLWPLGRYIAGCPERSCGGHHSGGHERLCITDNSAHVRCRVVQTFDAVSGAALKHETSLDTLQTTMCVCALHDNNVCVIVQGCPQL